jgi:hypothetical protein
MTGCPGYLGMTVLDAADLTRLVHRDLVVFCPSQFNATVRLRLFTSDQSSDVVGRQLTSALVVRFSEADGRSQDVHVTLIRLNDETEAVVEEQPTSDDSAAVDLERAATAAVMLRLTVAICACGGLAAIFVVNYVGREVMKAAGATVNSGRLIDVVSATWLQRSLFLPAWVSSCISRPFVNVLNVIRTVWGCVTLFC